jgi:hypothetical protein
MTSYLFCGIRVCWYSFKGELLCLLIRRLSLRLLSSCRYGADLTPEQKDALLDVIRARPHPLISAEIRREILNSVVRGEPRPEEGAGDVNMV